MDPYLVDCHYTIIYHQVQNAHPPRHHASFIYHFVWPNDPKQIRRKWAHYAFTILENTQRVIQKHQISMWFQPFLAILTCHNSRKPHYTNICKPQTLWIFLQMYVHNKAMGKREMACNLTSSYEGSVPIRNMKVTPQWL